MELCLGLAAGRGVHTERHSVQDEEDALGSTYRPSPHPFEDEDDDCRKYVLNEICI
jgi:hypothetical protein